MLKEIRRIGLVSAGCVTGGLALGLVLVAGMVGIVGVGIDGDLATLAEIAGLDDEGEAMTAAEIAGILAVTGTLFVFAAAIAALVGGFLLGVFLAAFYNVTAGLAGGLRVEIDPD